MKNESLHKNAMKRFDLTDKVALVVGDGGYFGLPICRALTEHGAHIIIADVQKEAAQRAKGLLEEDSFSAEAMILDISDEDAVKVAVDTIVSRHGNLDIVVNLVAYSTGKSMEQMSLTDWGKGLRVSLSGAFSGSWAGDGCSG